MEEDSSWGQCWLRSNAVCRIIMGAALTLSLAVSASPAQAQTGSRAGPSGDETLMQGWMGKRYAKSFGVPETPAMKVNPTQDGRFLMANLSPPRPFDRQPPFTIVSPTSGPLPSRSKSDNLRDRTLTQARTYLGTPYRRGGSLQTGHATDCSGFVQFIYKKANIDLPRSSSEQARVGTLVARTLDFARMLPGDLLFFGYRGRHVGHAGIYLGDGKMIHASDRLRGVIISDLRQPSLEGAFVVAKRVFDTKLPSNK